MTREAYAEKLFLAWVAARMGTNERSPWVFLPSDIQDAWRQIAAIALSFAPQVD